VTGLISPDSPTQTPSFNHGLLYYDAASKNTILFNCFDIFLTILSSYLTSGEGYGTGRHRRICLSIPIKFRMQLPENQEISWVNSGNLENISPGGVYFMSNDTPPLEPGQVRNFSITPANERLGFPGTLY
jgi:hypothetical protein